MSKLPQLRPPTRYEKFMFKFTKRWPTSYVEARLDNLYDTERALNRMTPEEGLRTVMEEDAT